ncbi:MAG: nuclear cap binding complex subunit [Watsoniomyces obsoletus]|nr:MAG: nuclear cap binding complex subunit [Watsoniomyces obsoletus]
MRIFLALATAISIKIAFTSPLPAQVEQEDRTAEAARVGAESLLLGEVLGAGVTGLIIWRLLRSHYAVKTTVPPELQPLSIAEIESIYRLLQGEAARYPGLHECAKRKVDAEYPAPDSLALKRTYIRSWVECENEIRVSSRERPQFPDDWDGGAFDDLMPSMVMRPEEILKSLRRPKINMNAVWGSVGRFGRNMVGNARIPKMMPRFLIR